MEPGKTYITLRIKTPNEALETISALIDVAESSTQGAATIALLLKEEKIGEATELAKLMQRGIASRVGTILGKLASPPTAEQQAGRNSSTLLH